MGHKCWILALIIPLKNNSVLWRQEKNYEIKKNGCIIWSPVQNGSFNNRSHKKNYQLSNNYIFVFFIIFFAAKKVFYKPYVESLALSGLMPKFRPGWTLGKHGFTGAILVLAEWRELTFSLDIFQGRTKTSIQS